RRALDTVCIDRTLCLLRARETGVLRHCDERAARLRLLHLQERRATRAGPERVMSHPTNRVVILGIYVTDLTFRASRMPVLGETIAGSAFAMGPGGKGSNQAVAAARAGADVVFCTRLGADAFGDIARSTWAAEGITARAVS